MKAVGIVAEYNPFHSGHRYHIAQTRRRLGAEVPVVCVMSGNWVQRGECALTDKWTRAEMALRAGSAVDRPDLILELPTPWAMSSAEGFARGAVGLLKATGVVDTLSFGSESGDLATLRALAEGLNSEAYRTALRDQLDRGRSFAEARQRSATRALGRGARLLRNPNDSLAVEYLRSAGEGMEAVAIPRQGVSHDSEEFAGEFASASALRNLVRREGPAALIPWMDRDAVALLSEAGTASMEQIERAVLARLRQMTEGGFAALPDSGAEEGLPERMGKAAAKAGTLEEFYRLAKTRRYAHARIRRLTMWAFLGLTGADRPENGPAYLRVLGMNGRGRAILKEMKGTATLPILTKPAHIKNLDERAQGLFALECRCTDLYGLCFAEPKPCGQEYTRGPVILL